MDSDVLIRIFAGSMILSTVLGVLAYYLGQRHRSNRAIAPKLGARIFGGVCFVGMLALFVTLIPIWAAIPIAMIQGFIGYHIASWNLTKGKLFWPTS